MDAPFKSKSLLSFAYPRLSLPLPPPPHLCDDTIFTFAYTRNLKNGNKRQPIFLKKKEKKEKKKKGAGGEMVQAPTFTS